MFDVIELEWILHVWNGFVHVHIHILGTLKQSPTRGGPMGLVAPTKFLEKNYVYMIIFKNIGTLMKFLFIKRFCWNC